MKRALAVIVLVLLALPPAAGAAQSRPGPYVSGFLGFNQTDDATLETTDFFNGTVQDYNLEFDPGVYVGGTMGFDYGPLRLEGEFSFRDAEIATITSFNGTRSRGGDSSLGIFAFMANGFFDLENSSPITPYLGGGAGFATLVLDEDVFDGNGDPIYYEDSATTYAVQAGGGVEIALNRGISLDIGYRYFRTGEATFDKFRDLENELEIESHNFSVGFRARF